MSEPLKITAEVQKLNPDALIELYVLDLTRLGGQVYRFHNQRVNGAGILTFDGVAFEPMPFEAKGWAFNGTEQPAAPTIKVSNLSGVIAGLVEQFGGLVNATLTRIRTFRKHLDDGSDPDGQAKFAEDVFIVNRKMADNKLWVEFELGSSLDVDGVQLPRRRKLPRCQWIFRDGANCPYVGSDVTCGKKITDCAAKFPGQELPFGGFPAVERLNIAF